MAIVLCKSRVLYLGSAIPLETAVGIEAVQSPLNQRYNPDYSNRVSAIDATLTVYSNGLRLEFPGDSSFTAWMPIQTLHVCAAVKPVMTSVGTRFLPLDDAPASSSIQHPPIFACIMRRTRGVKVLDCHGFICKSNEVALTIVHATMHAYQHREGWTSDTDMMINYSRSENNCSSGFGAAMNAKNAGFGCHHHNNNMNNSSMQQNSCGSFFRQDLVSTFNINSCDTSFASQFPQPPVEKPSLPPAVQPPPAPVQPPPAPAQPAVQVTAPITTPTVTVPQTIAVQPTQIMTQATTLVPQFTIQQQPATVMPYATQIPTMQFPMMQQPMPAMMAEEYFADWDEYGGEAVMFNPESPFYPGEEYVEKMNKGKKKKKDDKKKHMKGKGDGSSADDEETMYYVKRSGGQGKGGVSEKDVIRLTNSLENRCQVETNQYETSRNGGKHYKNAVKDSKVSKAKSRSKTTQSSEDENVELYYMKVPKNKCASSGETVTKEVVQAQQTERVKEPESSPQETVTVSRVALRLDDVYESHLPDLNVDYADIQRPNGFPDQPPVDYDQSPQTGNDYIVQGREYFGGQIPNQADFMPYPPFPPFQQQQPFGDVYGQSNGMAPEGQYLAPRDFYMDNPIPPNPMLDHLLNNDYGNVINGLGYYP